MAELYTKPLNKSKKNDESKTLNPKRACHEAASGFHGNFTSSWTPWLGLGAGLDTVGLKVLQSLALSF